MTETNATTSGRAPVFPPGRYGRRRRAEPVPGQPRAARRRLVTALLAVAVVVAGLAVAFRLHDQYGNGPYDTELAGYTDVTDAQVVIRFRVNLPAGKSALCTVRARNRAGAEVGRAEVRVPADPSRRPLVTYRLATSERPVTGEIRGCGPAR